MTDKKRLTTKILASVGLLAILVLLGCLMLGGGNFELLKSAIKNEYTTEELRDLLRGFGWRGYITIVVLAMLQIVIPVLPAEPVQVLAGVTFGFPIGLLLCTIGVLLGNTVIFVLYKVYGNGIRQYFVKNLHFDFDRAARSKRATALIFILYFLPAIPYGMICFFGASLGMKYPRYIIVTLLGAIPSVCIGVGLGHIAVGSWILSLIILAVLIVLLSVLMAKREAIFAKVNEYADRPPYSSKTVVSKYPSRRLVIPYIISVIVFALKGVRVRCKKRIEGEVASPSVVLCNHGSFIDFAYAGYLTKRVSPNFIVARLYFYHKWLGRLLKSVGCFPKSMFAADLESAKNCLRVLKNGGVLAMMPEARLSTAGRFEDIQPGTFAFIKRAAVPIYTIKIHGDYLADPKWGHGLRRGSLVEAELDILFTPEELEALSVEQIEQRVVERLYYDEMSWLEEHPKLRYRSRRLAEGLENILSICPKCKSKYTITAKKRVVSCEKCGKLATINDRYKFVGSEPFESFVQWYDWQMEQMREQILADESFALTSRVEYLLPSADGRSLLRHAGEGVCTLSREGLVYEGSCDGEECRTVFPMKQIYRLLFGAGENFEVYQGSVINYFRPEERRSAVDFYMASIVLCDELSGEAE